MRSYCAPALFFFFSFTAFTLFPGGSCRAEEALFRDGVANYAWGSPYAHFSGRQDMECWAKELFCRTKADENAVLGLPSGPMFFSFDKTRGLYQIELFFEEQQYPAFAEKIAPVVKKPSFGGKTRGGVTADGISVSIRYAEEAAMEAVIITNKKFTGKAL